MAEKDSVPIKLGFVFVIVIFESCGFEKVCENAYI